MTSVHARLPTFKAQSLHGVPCDFIGNQQQIVWSGKYVIKSQVLSEEQ